MNFFLDELQQWQNQSVRLSRSEFDILAQVRWNQTSHESQQMAFWPKSTSSWQQPQGYLGSWRLVGPGFNWMSLLNRTNRKMVVTARARGPHIRFQWHQFTTGHRQDRLTVGRSRWWEVTCIAGHATPPSWIPVVASLLWVPTPVTRKIHNSWVVGRNRRGLGTFMHVLAKFWLATRPQVVVMLAFTGDQIPRACLGVRAKLPTMGWKTNDLALIRVFLISNSNSNYRMATKWHTYLLGARKRSLAFFFFFF